MKEPMVLDGSRVAAEIKASLAGQSGLFPHDVTDSLYVFVSTILPYIRRVVE
ncbi:hypothetical protein PM3016_2628 [Paenibacillus mucilaginosus 3016]|uniref:Uncharacterized protein n=1 Tax=Paenibacillus mucilaginosus 3016 TaxID=1116391 RepID=H6NFA1_9BACL|nr:hypothetical protein [Paenibacillus mucilaginosus]AFC29510.1 hypothetical protein PM3016_2628 [Paenibacillus mucilaginosus 3016]